MSTSSASQYPRTQSETVALGVLAGAILLVITAYGLSRACRLWQVESGTLTFKGTMLDAHRSELPTPNDTRAKDGEVFGESDIGQRYEMDAQSIRSFKTRVSRAFSLRKKVVVDRFTSEGGRMTSSDSSLLHLDAPPGTKGLLVLEAIILPELPAATVEVERSASTLDSTVMARSLDAKHKNRETDELDMSRNNRLMSLKAEEEDIRQMIVDLESRKLSKKESAEK